MLTRLVCLVGAAAFLWAGGPAAGQTPSDVSCPVRSPYCVVEASSPGAPVATAVPAAGGGDPSSQTPCVAATGEQVPCLDGFFGWFNVADSCYWKPTNPQPPGDLPIWEGHYPDGQIWDVVCIVHDPGSHAGRAWRASPPPGYGGGPSPAQLAQEAVAQMQLAGPAIHLSIPADRFGVVGVPVWLWTQVGPTTWGPNSATASVPGLSVTATAQAQQIVWDTGDGETVTCVNPGTPYAAGEVTSPTCQHIYATSSAAMPGEAFPLTATTTWLVTWSGGGSSGSLTVRRSSSASVRIGEVQVLVTNG